jgi:threonine dehydratase
MATSNLSPSPKTTQVDWKTIVEAHERICPRIHRTPVFTSHSLDKIIGAQLFFKCENLQKTGSFKIRGAANAILSLTSQQSAKGVVTHSSGNHGAAVACAAGWLGIPSWIVMPHDTAAVKCRAVESYGGKITFCEPGVSARAEALTKLQLETGAAMIHPYDDDRIIAGQATAAKELLEEIADLDAMLTPVSGGGLLSGTCLGAKALRPEVLIFGCEPERADDAYRSLQSKELQRQESSDTIADGLRASLSPRTFAILQDHVQGILLVSEKEIMDTQRMVAQRMKLVIEPSSAVALAPMLRKGVLESMHLPKRKDGLPPKIGIILSGGNVDLN